VSEVVEVRGSVKAVEAALKHARSGDVLLLQADVIDETVEFIKRYLTNKQSSGREVSIAELLQNLSEAIVMAADGVE
jgi:cyanophycin synthetase